MAAPVLALLIQNAAIDYEASRQRKCENRSLTQAMASCGANPSHYRRETKRYEYDDNYEFDVLTLVAPGTTDAAWQCLNQWSAYHGSVSIYIDKSVYDQARSTTGR